MPLKECPLCQSPLESDAGGAFPDRCPACGASQSCSAGRSLSLVVRDRTTTSREVDTITLSDEFLARYRLDTPIGCGAMGMVYAAIHLGLSTRVAIKFLVRTDRREDLLRFLREAQVMGQIQHPNVVRVLDSGETSGHPYIVMEYMPVGTLRSALRDTGRMAPRDAVRLAIDVLQGLDACHARGIVHRDLKPENVLIGDGQVAKVADLGLASIRERHTRLTHAGEVLGTVAYMAPEQLQGQPIDGRADVYSVGVVLYEMLSGRCPFDDAALAELVRRIITELPPPLDRIAGDVPRSLAAIVDVALSKAPADRPPSAGELTRLLGDWARHGAGTTSPRLRRRVRAPRRHRWPVAIVGIIGLAVLIAFWARAPDPGRGDPRVLAVSTSPAIDLATPQVKPHPGQEACRPDPALALIAERYERLHTRFMSEVYGWLGESRPTGDSIETIQADLGWFQRQVDVALAGARKADPDGANRHAVMAVRCYFLACRFAASCLESGLSFVHLLIEPGSGYYGSRQLDNLSSFLAALPVLANTLAVPDPPAGADPLIVLRTVGWVSLNAVQMPWEPALGSSLDSLHRSMQADLRRRVGATGEDWAQAVRFAWDLFAEKADVLSRDEVRRRTLEAAIPVGRNVPGHQARCEALADLFSRLRGREPGGDRKRLNRVADLSSLWAPPCGIPEVGRRARPDGAPANP